MRETRALERQRVHDTKATREVMERNEKVKTILHKDGRIIRFIIG